MMGVVEHLISLWNIIKKFKKILKKNGWIYIATPNSNGINSKLNKAKWKEILLEHHLLLFNSYNLELMLIKAGLTKYKRLCWFIKYKKGLFRAFVGYVLQFFLIDGALRYLVWNNKN